MKVAPCRLSTSESLHLSPVFVLFIFYFLIIYYYYYFWLCWVFVAVRGLLIAVASLVAEHGL